jgi:hypothetical protein
MDQIIIKQILNKATIWNISKAIRVALKVDKNHKIGIKHKITKHLYTEFKELDCIISVHRIPGKIIIRITTVNR